METSSSATTYIGGDSWSLTKQQSSRSTVLGLAVMLICRVLWYAIPKFSAVASGVNRIVARTDNY